jgi:hypothetical protein
MIDFPASPTNGQSVTTPSGSVFIWDGVKWTSSAVGGGVTISDTAPSSPAVGSEWWDSVGGQLYIRYNDGNTSQWVPATNQATNFSAPLSVANGGTGTGTAFTAGSVVFAGASGVYNQNNANLFWDNTNVRLGIGLTTNQAGAVLAVYSNARPGLSLYSNCQTLPPIATTDSAFVIQANQSNGWSEIDFINANQYSGGDYQGFRFIQMTGAGASRDLMWMHGDGTVTVPGNLRIPDETSTGSLNIGSLGSYLGRISSDGSTILSTAQGLMYLQCGVRVGDYHIYEAGAPLLVIKGSITPKRACGVIRARMRGREIGPLRADAICALDPVVFVGSRG